MQLLSNTTRLPCLPTQCDAHPVSSLCPSQLLQDSVEYSEESSDAPLKRKSPYILKRQTGHSTKSRRPYILKRSAIYWHPRDYRTLQGTGSHTACDNVLFFLSSCGCSVYFCSCSGFHPVRPFDCTWCAEACLYPAAEKEILRIIQAGFLWEPPIIPSLCSDLVMFQGVIKDFLNQSCSDVTLCSLMYALLFFLCYTLIMLRKYAGDQFQVWPDDILVNMCKLGVYVQWSSHYIKVYFLTHQQDLFVFLPFLSTDCRNVVTSFKCNRCSHLETQLNAKRDFRPLRLMGPKRSGGTWKGQTSRVKAIEAAWGSSCQRSAVVHGPVPASRGRCCCFSHLKLECWPERVEGKNKNKKQFSVCCIRQTNKHLNAGGYIIMKS